jgi:hypothetical protein
VNWQKPSPELVWRAIDSYLSIAYTTEPSATVRTRLDSLRAANDDSFFENSIFENDKQDPPQRYCLRLGNRFYPHMKLVIERTPDGAGYMFRADTHDKHVRPAPGSKEYSVFCELMENNQKLAEQIDARWEQQGIPTFKQYLKKDLARRAAARPC